MKRLFSLILALLTVGFAAVPVCAKKWKDGYELGEYLPVRTVVEDAASIREGEDVFKKMWVEKTKIYTVYRDGELVGQVMTYIQDGKVVYGELEESFTVGHIIEAYGTDCWTMLSYNGDRFMYYTGTSHLIPLENFTEDGIYKEVYRYSMSQYMNAATFLEWQPNIEEPKYRDFESDGITGELVLLAEEYWENYYSEHEVKSSMVSFYVIGGIVLFLVALIAVIIWFDKRGKLKIDNSIVGKFWIPALCKGVTWRLK